MSAVGAPSVGSASAASSFAPYEQAGPTMLSRQPARTNDNAVPDLMADDWQEIWDHLELRLNTLRTWRWSWWAYWALLAAFILPYRYHWLIVQNLTNRGAPDNQNIVDSTPTLAVRVCAAGMREGLMPSDRPWFKLGPGLPGLEIDKPAKDWYDDTAKRSFLVLAQSNFYTSMDQVTLDLVTFGTSPVICYEDAEDVVRFYVPCAGEYFLGVGARFSVDTLYREFVLTVLQIVDMFQFENCPLDVQQMWTEGGAACEKEYTICHAIEPNFDIASRSGRRTIRVLKGQFIYREFYWVKGLATARPLSKRGFNDRPFAAARWSVTSNDPYGRGPGMDALPDAKQLQQQTKREAEAIEKQVRPPMGADASLQEQPASINPGQITYFNTADGHPKFFPLYEVKPDIGAMRESRKEVQDRIKVTFLNDVFMAITEMEGVQPRNDLEIQERKAEKLQRLGPVIGLWKTEVAGPIIQRVLNIMLRRRLLKPLPPSLIGVPLQIEYIDMVTLAQLGAETASMERMFQVMGSLSAATQAVGVPNPARVVNWDKSAEIYAEKIDYPSEGMYTPAEVAQHDAMKLKMVQQQQQAAQMAAAVQGAQTLSQTKLGGGQSALDLVAGQAQGNA
jgi:hypothetical protein